MEDLVTKELLMDSLKLTYEKAVHDNTDDFMCLSEMIVALTAILKAKGIITEEEAEAVYNVPTKRLEEEKWHMLLYLQL